MGLTQERRPLREKLWAWWTYAALGVLGLVLVPFTLAGFGSDVPGRARLVGLAVLLPLSLGVLAYALIAFRHQRR